MDILHLRSRGEHSILETRGGMMISEALGKVIFKIIKIYFFYFRNSISQNVTYDNASTSL